MHNQMAHVLARHLQEQVVKEKLTCLCKELLLQAVLLMKRNQGRHNHRHSIVAEAKLIKWRQVTVVKMAVKSAMIGIALNVHLGIRESTIPVKRKVAQILVAWIAVQMFATNASRDSRRILMASAHGSDRLDARKRTACCVRRPELDARSASLATS